MWDVWLSDAEVDQHATLMPYQIVNRFPAMADCCRKAVFATIFSRLRRLLPTSSPLNDGRYIPAQWSLPRQREALCEHVETQQQGQGQGRGGQQHGGGQPQYYIVKPDIGSQGDGIKLTSEPTSRRLWGVGGAGQERVVQQYIDDPMLLDGLKFDLRLYALLADVANDGGADSDDGGPMRLFLYREGLARFAVDEYEPPTNENLRNVHMHLTNYSINRKASNFRYCDDADGGDGSKRTVSSVFERLQRTGRIASVSELWTDIEALVARSLGVIQPILAGSRGRWSNACFQVLGLDVLLDSSGRPWLMEINDHPSLRADLIVEGGVSVPSAVDEAIKIPMLRDVVRLVSSLHSLGCAGAEAAAEADEDAIPSYMPSAGASSAGASSTSSSSVGASSITTASSAAEAAEAAVAIAATASSAAAAAAIAATTASGVDFDFGGNSEEETAASPSSSATTRTRATEAPSVGSGVFGTHFHEVVSTDGEARHNQLLARLREVFELHSPSSSVFEATWGDATREDAQATTSAGPRWRAATFSKFCISAGLVGGHRASAVAAGLSRPDADQIFNLVCGKGGQMDLMDFAEALGRVASRLYAPRRSGKRGGGRGGGGGGSDSDGGDSDDDDDGRWGIASSRRRAPATSRGGTAAADEPQPSPTELIERLLARHFTEGNACAAAPASARAATAARAAAVGRAAAAARANRGM